MNRYGGKINYGWRVFATALCFCLFGVGGILIALIALPASLLLSGDPLERFAKNLIQFAFRVFIQIMSLLGILRFEIDGFEKLVDSGQIIVANHPTLIDIVFLIALVPKADCIVKSQLFSNLFIRGAIGFAGYISNDDPERVLDMAAASLARGNNLVVFPEGTRSKRNEPLRLLRGAANIAIQTQHNLRPVIIACDPLTLGKGDAWYQIPKRRFNYRLSVRENLFVGRYLLEERTLASRKLTKILESYLSEESHWYGRTGT